MVNEVKETGKTFIIGKRGQPEAILMKFPRHFNPKFNEITNINAMSGSFDFLLDEPDLYTLKDIKRKYA